MIELEDLSDIPRNFDSLADVDRWLVDNTRFGPATILGRGNVGLTYPNQAARLSIYYLYHGHCRVLKRDPMWNPLHQFLVRLRSDSTNYPDRIELFESYLPPEVSMWDTESEVTHLPPAQPSALNKFDKKWLRQLRRLEVFSKYFGTTRVRLRPWPARHPILTLASWVNQQRHLYAKGNLSQSRVDRLSEAGFDLIPPQSRLTYSFPSGIRDEAHALSAWLEGVGEQYDPGGVPSEKKTMRLQPGIASLEEHAKTVRALGMTSKWQYAAWAYGDTTRYGEFPESFHKNPNKYFENRGWIDWPTFFGKI